MGYESTWRWNLRTKNFAHIIQEEVYETEDEQGWKNRKDAVETVREAVIPNAYQNLKLTFVLLPKGMVEASRSKTI